MAAFYDRPSIMYRAKQDRIKVTGSRITHYSTALGASPVEP